MNKVSIIICTRNRAASLQMTLLALQDITVPETMRAELIVVDNGSTDSTRKVVESANLPQLPVRYVVEPRKGKGYACNTGLTEATGDIFLFTDDDVRPPRNWIEVMCLPIILHTADAVAGAVVFPLEQENAIARKGLNLPRCWLAATDQIDPSHPQQMVGANMAFGRHVLRYVPAFDVKLGPGALGFGEESLFCSQLLDAGLRLVTAFDAAVEHHFDLSRLNRKGLLNLAHGMGRSDAYLSWHWRQETFSFSWGNLLRGWIGLSLRRLRNLPALFDHETLPEWEFYMISDLAFRRQYLIERRQPRRYTPTTQPAR